MKVKEAIIKLKKKKSIREKAITLGVARSTAGYILKKKESMGELNIKRPGRPRKTIKVDDRRILSLVKKNPFITSTEIRNTLEEAHHCQNLQSRDAFLNIQRVYNKVQSTGNIQEQESNLKSLPCSGIRLFGLMKARLTCTKLMGREKYGERKEKLTIQGTTCINCQTWACMAANGMGSLKTKAKKWIILQWPSQLPDFNPIEHAFQLLKSERPTNNQQLKVAAVKTWQSISKEETDVMSMGSRLQAVIDCKGFSSKY